MWWQCAKQLTHWRFSLQGNLCARLTKITSQIMHIFHHPWSIQTRVKQSPATHDWWMIPKPLKYGRWRLGKILAEWHRVTTKTGQAGTNSVFVMTHGEIDIAMKAGHKWTYGRVVFDYCPQKEDPNWIRIAVGGNLITYKGDTSMRTADLTTSKLS